MVQQIACHPKSLAFRWIFRVDPAKKSAVLPFLPGQKQLFLKQNELLTISTE